MAFKPPRIQTATRIVDVAGPVPGAPTVQFVKFINVDFAGAVEGALADIQTQVDALAAVLAGTTPFTGLNVGGTQVKPFLDKTDGTRVSDVTALPANQNTSLGLRVGATLSTVVDGGVSATISVAAHTFQLGGETVSLDGGSVAGLDLETAYYIYYDDPSYAGGAVTYQATTDASDITANVGRFSVGYVLTPNAGGTGGTEDPSGPPWWKVE